MANLENLKKVREAIQTHRQNFHYGRFFSVSDSRRNGKTLWRVGKTDLANASKVLQENHCGTCACIAGFCAALAAPSELNQDLVWEIAEDWLELMPVESKWLFEPLDAEREASRGVNWEFELDAPHLLAFNYNKNFPGFSDCTRSAGYVEALRRLDFLIEYYLKEEQHGKLGESQEGS